MEIPFLEILGLALIVALLDLDNSAIGHFMISRPIVAGPLLGYFLKDISLGLQTGALLELLWIARLPLGGSIPANISLATAFAVYSGIQVRNLVPGAEAQAAIVGILWALPIGFLGGYLDNLLRMAFDKINGSLKAWVDAGEEARISLAIVQCLGLRFGATFILVLCLLPAVTMAAILSSLFFYPILEPSLEIVGWLLPAIGAAGVFKLFSEKGESLYMFVGFGATAVLGLMGVPGVIVMGLIVGTAMFLVLVPLQRVLRALTRKAKRSRS